MIALKKTGKKIRRRNRRPVFPLGATDLPALGELEPPYAVEPPLGWDDLDDVVRRAPPSAVVVVDPYAGSRPGEAFPRLRDLLRRFPSLAVVAAMELKTENVADVLTLLEWGVAEVVDVRLDATPRALRARLAQAHARPFKRRLEGALSTYVSSEARQLLLAAAEVAVEGGGAPELAARLGVGPRVLTDRCQRADLPPPRLVQAWMRILLACSLLEDPGRTVYSAAYACGYSTDRSLRRAMAGLLGADATALRREGAFATASRAFNEALRALRETARERRRGTRGDED